MSVFDDLKEQATSLFNKIACRLRAELQSPWEETAPGQFKFLDWDSWWGAVKLDVEYRYGAPAANVILRVHNYVALGSNTLPVKRYIWREGNWENEFPKALALIRKRADVVIADQAKRAEIDADRLAYNARLQAAIAAAQFPDYCHREPNWEEGRPEFTGGKPRLVGTPETLQISMDDRWDVTGEEAAQIFTIVGGKLELKIVSDLTPEQFIALRQIVGGK